MKTEHETLGERLARLRKAKGLTQDQLAKMAEAGQSTVATLERDGRTTTPGSIVEIAHVLGVDAYYLKTGVRTLVAGDRTINQIVELLVATNKEGRAVILNKAKEMSEQYPIDDYGKQQKSS